MAAHWELVASGEIFVDEFDLLGDVVEGFVEQIVAQVFDFLEIVLGSFGALSGVFKVPVGGFEPVLDGFEALDGAHVRGHMVQLVVQHFDPILELILEFVIVALV